MKKLIIPFIIILAIFSCKKEDGNKNDKSLIGTFKLTEILADPGDGSGTFQPVNSNKTITFHENGTVNSNGELCDMSIDSNTPSSGTYTLTDSTITASNCSSFDLKFSFNGYELIINYPCIEPCRAKYKK